MLFPRVRAVILSVLIAGPAAMSAGAQMPPARDTSATDALLDQARRMNVLTTAGAAPFHAVLDITPANGEDPGHQGSIELHWADPTHYRAQVKSPGFGQLLIINGDAVQETDEGDFYPTWLQNFVNALLKPLALADKIQGHNDQEDDPRFKDLCVVRDQRRNNVLDASAFGRICFDKTRHMELSHALDFTHWLRFSDFRPFHDKSIARSYESSTRDGVDLRGTLRVLEDWRPDPAMVAVAAVTPAAGRIVTTYVPSSTAERMLLPSPHDTGWPTVREGNLEGNMVLHVVTDRTGHVREASPYESDNEALEAYGRELALRYRFKPLLVDGAPVQMEMPLVIHFKTSIANGIPEVDDAWVRSHVRCGLPTKVNWPQQAGKEVDVVLRISADGKLSGIHGANGELAAVLFKMKSGCTFPPVMQNGAPSEYLAHLKVAAK